MATFATVTATPRNSSVPAVMPDVENGSYDVELGGSVYNAFVDISGAPWLDQVAYEWLNSSTLVVHSSVEQLEGEYAWSSNISVFGNIEDGWLEEFYNSYLYARSLSGELYAEGSGTLSFSVVDGGEVVVDGGFTVYLGYGAGEFYGFSDQSQRIYGGDGNDEITTGNGDDFIFGQYGNDELDGRDGNDWIEGGTGGDGIFGGNDEDSLFGQDGNDYLRGGDGDDIVSGGDGQDYLRGDDGDDTLNGNAGDDYVDGGAGDDRIIDGAGNDTYFGGDGADTFVFNAVAGDGAQHDVIIDFDPMVDMAIVYDGVGNIANAYNDALASEGVAIYGDHFVEFIGITPMDDEDWFGGKG